MASGMAASRPTLCTPYAVEGFHREGGRPRGGLVGVNGQHTARRLDLFGGGGGDRDGRTDPDTDVDAEAGEGRRGHRWTPWRARELVRPSTWAVCGGDLLPFTKPGDPVVCGAAYLGITVTPAARAPETTLPFVHPFALQFLSASSGSFNCGAAQGFASFTQASKRTTCS